MGSSSTLGVGASTPAFSYPSRLEQELRHRFPGLDIRVINHGVGGQDVPEELTRLGRDVIAEHPDLVIWQVGTNAVLRRDDLSADEQLISRGVAVMKESGIDVVLMDLQYAPRVLARPAYAEMERLIADLARGTKVGLFRRFEIMKEWDHTEQLAPASSVGPDGLHMTDAGYACLANQLAEALASNWRSQRQAREIASTHSRHDRRHRAPEWRAARRVLAAELTETYIGSFLDNERGGCRARLESAVLRQNAAVTRRFAISCRGSTPIGAARLDLNLDFYWVSPQFNIC